MVLMTFKPFGKTLFKGQLSQYHKRAMWACIAPYLISQDKPPTKQPQPKFDIRGQPKQQRKPTRFRWRLRSVYLGQFMIIANDATASIPRRGLKAPKDGRKRNSSSSLLRSALHSQDLIDWIVDLIDAPSKKSLKAKWRKSQRDLLTVFAVISVYLRMQAFQDQGVRWSLENAKCICRAQLGGGDWWKTDRYIDMALSRHKASAHIIFGMIQAILEQKAGGGPLPVAKIEHVDELRLFGWKYVTRGIQYASYAQDQLTRAIPKHGSRSWLDRQALWCLPNFAQPKRKPRIRLEKLTKPELAVLQGARSSRKSKGAATVEHVSDSAPPHEPAGSEIVNSATPPTHP